MRTKIWGCLILAAVAAAVLFPIVPASAGDAYELYQMLPENVDSFVYLRDLKAGLRPFLSSDYYDEVSDLTVFEGPIRSDLSAPLLSGLGGIEKDTGVRPTLRRILWLVGKRAVFFTTRTSGGEAKACLLQTGRFKGFLINLVSVFSSHVAKENWGDYTVWVVSVGERKFWYRNEKGYTVVSSSPDLLKQELSIVSGQEPRTLSGNAEVMGRLAAMPKEYQILTYSTKVMSPDSSKTGLAARAGRLLEGTDALLCAVTFTKTGADVVVRAPASAGENRSGLLALGELTDKAPVDLSTMPGETAALVVFSAFDPAIVYTHFGRTWFADIAEKANYITILNKWKEKGGFDLEGGIINNLGRGATAALVGVGYEGKKPYLKAIASVGVAGGDRVKLSENLSKLYTYSFFDSGPQTLSFGPAEISYMGEFRQKSLEWDGKNYLLTVKANPGFAFFGDKLFLFWDFSTMERAVDLGALASMTKANDLFDRDFLAKSPSFALAAKEMPPGSFDLYLYVDGNNLMSIFETYLVNLSANTGYFLYRDSEKLLVPLAELTKRSFVSLSGGINFTSNAIEGRFRLATKDLD
jgi:hypothetical protein